MLSDKKQPIILPSLVDWGSDEWRQEASCKGTPTDDFFTFDPSKVSKIKALCKLCPVKSECLQFALTNDISWGIYGGMTSKERNRAFKHVVSKR